jgi:hypothetical protein
MGKPKKEEAVSVSVATIDPATEAVISVTTVTATRLEDGTILDTVEAHELAAKKAAESDTRPEEVNNG